MLIRMESQKSADLGFARVVTDAIGDAFEMIGRKLAELLETQRLEQEKASNKFQEALHEQEKMMLREMERRLQKKNDKIRDLKRLLNATRKRVSAVENRTAALERSGGGSVLQRLEGRVQMVEESLLTLIPRDEAPLRHLEEPHSTGASFAPAASRSAPAAGGGERPLPPMPSMNERLSSFGSIAIARSAPAAGGAAAGGGERPLPPMPQFPLLNKPLPSFESVATAASLSVGKALETEVAAMGGWEETFPAPFSSSTPIPLSPGAGAGFEAAMTDKEERQRRRVELRAQEVHLRADESRNSSAVLVKELCDAAYEGRLEDVQHLIDSGANVNGTDASGRKPLICAVLNARVPVVSLLLQRGADANAANRNGNSALHWAATMARSGRCVELLVSAGGDANARDMEGVTPLHHAAFYKNRKAVSALLAAGARRDLKAWSGNWKNMSPYDVAKSPVLLNDLKR